MDGVNGVYGVNSVNGDIGYNRTALWVRLRRRKRVDRVNGVHCFLTVNPGGSANVQALQGTVRKIDRNNSRAELRQFY